MTLRLYRDDPVFSTAPDGKHYDAYVSFLYPDTLISNEMASFALQVLPEELENQHGYSLYIRGRDDCPGEGQEQTLTWFTFKCVIQQRCLVEFSWKQAPKQVVCILVV